MAKKDKRALAEGVEEHLTPMELAALEAIEGPGSDVVPEEAAPVSPAPKADVTALPDREPQLTAERMFVARKADSIVEAYLHAERLRPEGVRKMSRAGWLADLEAFKAAPRG
jgi:hypothetical protein